MICKACHNQCQLNEGQTGVCRARRCEDGAVKCANYGLVTSIALDPIEKKPLNRFHPGSLVVSVGSYGCNLRCPFCQNSEISWSDEALRLRDKAEYLAPEDLADIAARYRNRGNIGLAFTYNEPLIGYEYVRDAARLVHERGMKNVLVTNGTASLDVLEELLPYIDAMNIDLKGFADHYYSDVLGGDRQMVMDFIERAVKGCHVELTTLIVPSENDNEEEIREMTGWIAGLKNAEGEKVGAEIPLHVSRFFPRFRMTDRDATAVKKVYRLADTARERLKYVYTGNC